MKNINEFVPLGKNKLEIQRFGLGTAHIPKQGEAMAIATVQEAWNQGVRFFDTAPLYTSGESETYIGKALADIPKSDYVLATKVGKIIEPGQKPIVDFSRDGVLRSLEESLERLQVDHIDILHIHDPDDHYRWALDEAFPTLAELRDQGVIKAIGSGMNQWEMLADFARNADFDCFLLAGRYTLLEQKSVGFLELCAEKKIGVILGGVYNTGILASNLGADTTYNYRSAPPEILEQAQRVQAVCDDFDVPLNVAALHFPFQHPGVTSIVVGAERPEQVVQNLEALEFDVPNALWAALATIQ